MVNELKAWEDTVKTFKEIPEFQKFQEHIGKLDFKTQLDELDDVIDYLF